MSVVNIRVVGGGGHDCAFEISSDETVELLMTLIESDMGVPAHHQRLVYLGRVLNPALTLAAQGITRDSTIQLQQQATTANQQEARSPGSGPTTTGLQPASPGASAQPETVEQQIAKLFASGRTGGTPPPAPALAGGKLPPPAGAAVASRVPSTQGDPTIDEQVRRLFQQPPGTQAQMRERVSRLLAQQPPPLDPLDPEYQRRMYEQIQQQNMLENLNQALEYTPEAFARVVMLYVPSTVNKVPVTAFVDSGAQMTIMNEATAERCGIMRLIDRRMSGVAKGVGTSRIIGRIHMAMVELGGIFVPMSITVLESQDMEFLIGLDQLRRHKMCIDLDKNCLRLQEKEIPFLGEGELPLHLRGGPEEGAGESAGSTSKAPPHASAAPTSGGGAPAQPNPAPAPTAGSAAATDTSRRQYEDKVQRLMQLSGAPRAIVENALAASDGNEDIAAGLLFE
jgi:DNA damage-inducible protein 1